MKVPFFEPDIGEAEIEEVVQCLRRGWLTTGPKASQFENDFREYLGGNVECVSVNSATAGLHLAVEALGISDGDEIIVPDYTFTATAEIVRYMGAEPILIDVDKRTLNITPEGVKKAITKKTKAVIPVHFAGLAADMPGILSVARDAGIAVIEDAAHALPAFKDGTMVGQFDSDATIFSFYANKTITTGEGGMLVTKNPELAKRARTMRLHGFDRDAFDRFKGGGWKYDIVAPGFKYNMTDIAAGIGIHQLKKSQQFRDSRHRIAKRYIKGLEGLPIELPVDGDSQNDHSWHIFGIRIRPETGVKRDDLLVAMVDRGISCSVHYRPLHAMTYWRERYSLKEDQFPVAHLAGEQSISLPIYPKMPDEQVDYVVSTLWELLGQ